MDRHFDESWFETTATNQQEQPAPAHPQNTPQQNITNDLLDIFSPTSAQTNPPQKTQTTSEPPLIDLLSDTPYTNASTPGSTPGYSHLSMSEFTPHSLIDTSNTSPSSYNKSTYQKAVPHYVNLNQVPASFTPAPKENFTGIYGFFGSKELPPTTKQISLSDIPAGLEAIPFIFQNKCYYQGLGLLDQYMKLAPTPEEKMYYKILKIMCLIKQGMWDGVTSEFSSIGNLEKMMTETKHEIYLPYHLRLLYALAPFLSAPLQHKSSSSSSAPKGSDEKTLDRLFQLYYFCENKAGEINESDLYHDENVDMFTICDADISPQQWAARLFRVTLLIIEILLFKTSSRAAHEVIKNAMQKFPRNEILMAYMVRLKQLEGDYKDARFFLDKINEKLPKDEHLEFILFNTFAQSAYEMKFPEAKKLLEELAQKYPQYSTLAYNNLAYLFIAEGQIEKAIKILEDLIRTEPWNINEVICLNLIYLYDFYYVDSKNRKRVLEEIVDRYAMNFSRASISHELRS